MEQSAESMKSGGASGFLSRYGPVLLIVGVLAFYWYGTRPVGEPPGWGHDYAAAISQAQSSGKKLLLAFHSPNCPPCLAMDRTVLRSETVINAMSPFVLVRLDTSAEGAEVAGRYGVMATPTFIIIQPDGRPLVQADGFLSEEQFIHFLGQGDQRV